MQLPQLHKLPTQYIQSQQFKVDLTQDQHAYLSTILPKCYTLQLDTRPKRQTKPPNRKATIDDISLYPQQSKNLGQNTNMHISTNTSKNKITQKLNTVNSEKSKKQPHLKQDKMDEGISACVKILNILKNSKFSWPFRQPVDPVILGIPNYYEIITQPMDLSTIQNNLQSGAYSLPNQFHTDVSKVISNSYIFNQGNPQFVKLTSDFEKVYLKATLDTTKVQNIQSIRPNNSAISVNNNKSKSKKKKANPLKQIPESQPVTTAQKHQLALYIHRLAKQHLKGIINIVFDGQNQYQDQFDLQKLDQKKLRQLQKYIRNKIAIMQHAQKISLQQQNQNPDTNDIHSQQVSYILDD